MPAWPATLRWTINGALFGFIVAWIDMLVEWRLQLATWRDDGIAYNFGYFAGAMTVAAIIGAMAGAFRDSHKRRAGLLMVPDHASASAAQPLEYRIFGWLTPVLYWLFLGIGVILAGGAIAAFYFANEHAALSLAMLSAIFAISAALLGLTSAWKVVIPVLGIALVIALGRYAFDQRKSQPGLWGNVRTYFVTGAVSRCHTLQSGRPENQGITADRIRNYCTCIANEVADNIKLYEAIRFVTREEMQVRFQTMHKDLIERTRSACAERQVNPH